MIRALLLAAGFGCAAAPAAALSCLAPDLARSFEQARAAEQIYAVVLGRFEFDRADLPAPGAEGATIPAVFDGRVLGPEGFVTETRRAMLLEVSCVMTSCGDIDPGVETLAFVEQGEDGLIVEISACPQWVFPDPSPAQLEAARSCMTGRCE